MDDIQMSGEGLPRNKMGIDDRNLLEIAEHALSDYGLKDLAINSLPGFTPDLNGAVAVHRHLFGELYHSAGKLRGEGFKADGKTVTPERHDEWNRWDHKTGKKEASFAAIPKDDPRVGALSAKAEKLGTLLDKGVMGDEALKSALPVVSKMIGDLNYIHPFYDGNGRAMKGFIEQTGRAFGLSMNTRRMDKQAWINASAAAMRGRPSSLTKLLRTHATVMNVEELAVDTAKVAAQRKVVEQKPEVRKKGLFRRLFRRTPKPVVAETPEIVVAAPKAKKASKPELDTQESNNRHIDQIIRSGRIANAKRGNRTEETAVLQGDIMRAVQNDVPLLGKKADPALIAEMGKNPILMGEVLVAQAAVDKMAEVKSLVGEIDAKKAETLTPHQQLKKLTQEVVNTKGSNLYLEALADSFADMSPSFARGYLPAKRMTKFLIEAQQVKTQMTSEQIKQSVRGLESVRGAEARTMQAAKALFAKPEEAVANLAAKTRREGLGQKEVNELIRTDAASIGKLKSFGPKGDAVMRRNVASFRQAVETQGKHVAKATEKVSLQQSEIVEALKRPVIAPTPDLDKTMQKVNTSKETLKALPKGANKARVQKEPTRLTDSLNEKTQIFGQSIPGVSDAQMMKLNDMKTRAATVQKATVTKTRTQSIGKGLSM